MYINTVLVHYDTSFGLIIGSRRAFEVMAVVLMSTDTRTGAQLLLVL